ncbi:hypothetical protein BC830DRAFT_1098341 [Chytriomyces sp. MP71]|nr:hypothetical protein BC830DRAFT_1098341 [Chytriomyces sp. MP71]
MGHTKCRRIAALMRGITDTEETEFLGPWMKIAEKARAKVIKHFSNKDLDTQTAPANMRRFCCPWRTS